jgi:hypothetical protein
MINFVILENILHNKVKTFSQYLIENDIPNEYRYAPLFYFDYLGTKDVLVKDGVDNSGSKYKIILERHTTNYVRRFLALKSFL